MEILTIAVQNEEKFLRQKTPDFNFDKVDKKEIQETIKMMKTVIRKNRGVGLSANQVGLSWRLFIAEIPGKKSRKFYAVFNPKIIKTSNEKIVLEEGCLSVPGLWGLVERPKEITFTGLDKNGKEIKISAWGLTARVCQHEIDHLNGALFIDKCEKVSAISDSQNANY